MTGTVVPKHAASIAKPKGATSPFIETPETKNANIYIIIFWYLKISLHITFKLFKFIKLFFSSLSSFEIF